MSYILYSSVLFVAPDTISCWYQVIGGYNMSHDQPLQYSAVVLSGGECCQWVQRNMNGWVSKEAKFTWHVQFPGDPGRKLTGRTSRIPRGALPAPFASPGPPSRLLRPVLALVSGLAPVLSLYRACPEIHVFHPLFALGALFFKFLTSKFSWDPTPGWGVVFSRAWTFSLLHEPHKDECWHLLTRAPRPHPCPPNDSHLESWHLPRLHTQLCFRSSSSHIVHSEPCSLSRSSVALISSCPCFPATLIETEFWRSNIGSPWPSSAGGQLVGSPNPDGFLWTARNLTLTVLGPVLLKPYPTLVKGIPIDTWVSLPHVGTESWASFLYVAKAHPSYNKHTCIKKGSRDWWDKDKNDLGTEFIMLCNCASSV